MQHLQLALVCVCLWASAKQVQSSEDALATGNFSSLLDHFALPDNRQDIQMTFVANWQHHDAVAGGPIFIQIQEGDRSTTEFLRSGLMYDIAVQQRAALVTFDLRYFHSNLPTESASTDRLRHLTVDQITHDIRALINTVRPNVIASSAPPIILFGRGLGATLATWTQRQFPGLVAGVWSSSGRYRSSVHTSVPVEYVAERIEAAGGRKCRQRLHEAFESMEMYMAWEAEMFVQYFFGLCTEADRRFGGETSAVFAGITQFIIDQINLRHSAAIDDLCATLNDINEFELHAAFVALGSWTQANQPGQRGCLDTSFLDRLRANRQTSWSDVWRNAWSENIAGSLVRPHQSRSQLWLSCTQLGGGLTTANTPNSTFGNQVGQDLFFGHCSVFADDGEAFDYGRLDGEIEALWTRMNVVGGTAERVVYTNGELDAWFPFGQTVTEQAEQVVINIPKYGASADVYSASSTDSVELAAAKQQIVRMIGLWIQTAYTEYIHI